MPEELVMHVFMLFAGYCGLVGLFFVGKFFYTWVMWDSRKIKTGETKK